jgi:hypothetical protein
LEIRGPGRVFSCRVRIISSVNVGSVRYLLIVKAVIPATNDTSRADTRTHGYKHTQARILHETVALVGEHVPLNVLRSDEDLSRLHCTLPRRACPLRSLLMGTRWDAGTNGAQDHYSRRTGMWQALIAKSRRDLKVSAANAASLWSRRPPHRHAPRFGQARQPAAP